MIILECTVRISSTYLSVLLRTFRQICDYNEERGGTLSNVT